MTLENPNWGNGVMLKSTLVKMPANALSKALKPSNIISCFKTTCIYSIFFYKYVLSFLTEILITFLF